MILVYNCFWYVIPISFMGLVYLPTNLVYHKNQLFMHENIPTSWILWGYDRLSNVLKNWELLHLWGSPTMAPNHDYSQSIHADPRNKKRRFSMFKTTDPRQCQGGALAVKIVKSIYAYTCVWLCVYIDIAIVYSICNPISLVYSSCLLMISYMYFPYYKSWSSTLLCHPRRPVHLPFLPHPRSQTCAWQQINQDGVKATGVIQGK